MARNIDADGHIVEPHALWNEYVEPQWRDKTRRRVSPAPGARTHPGEERFALSQSRLRFAR